MMMRPYLILVQFLLLICSAALAHASSETDVVWAGYQARIVCSGIFVSGRTLENILKFDVPRWNYRTRVDLATRQVMTDWDGGAVIARYRGPRLGCTLYPKGPPALFDSAAKRRSSGPHARKDARRSQLWPEGDRTAADKLTPQTQAQLAAFLDHEFSEDNPSNPTRNTRAIVVVHKGRIVAERYAQHLGIDKDSPLISWSLSKSVTSALVGILVDREKLELHKPLGFAEWKNDARAEITLDDLLRMSSGLNFIEADTTDRTSDVTRMLFAHADAAKYMLNLQLAHCPGTVFNYSTGDSILLSRAIRRSFHEDAIGYLEFPWKALFEPIGMKSAVFEQDTTGLFLGGTHMLATPRDWARFGLLYLQDGIWNGKRIISHEWIESTRKPTPWAIKDSNYYGAHFWLIDPVKAREKGIPEDTYLAAGFKGQVVFIIPSLDLVVVRMGWTEDENFKPYDILETVTHVTFSYVSESATRAF